ncbi:MAG: 50S ribosomal protein L11 methyltransferase [Myxococcales bacterium]|nr:50S ribosomal protein L11 methyltransferase [Myxococcales bacterium]MDD9970583.1 50S ribosomal protein L11 methyltransferase [Myxococcales bacterium]
MTLSQPRYPYVHIDVPPEEAELAALALWDLGAQGVEERDGRTFAPPNAAGRITLVGSFQDEEGAELAVAALTGSYPTRLMHVVGDAWRDGWRAHFKPTRVGERLVIRPSWEPYQANAADVVLTLDPGGAFGTGTHESTQLVLTMLEHVATPAAVLDVGCGSGVLSIAALLLGAGEALAIDIDPASVRTTRENAEVNGVSGRLSVSERPLASIEGVFPLVVANIEAHVLIPLADALRARVASGGCLILSGLLAHQIDEVLAAYPGAVCEIRRQVGDWVALQLRFDG